MHRRPWGAVRPLKQCSEKGLRELYCWNRNSWEAGCDGIPAEYYLRYAEGSPLRRRRGHANPASGTCHSGGGIDSGFRPATKICHRAIARGGSVASDGEWDSGGRIHLLAFRLLLLVGWMRVVRDVQREGGFYPKRLLTLDKVFLFWAFSNAVMFCLLWGQFAAVVNRLGFLYTTLGSYFLVRHFIRDKEDVIRTIKTLAILAMVMAPLMLSEHINGHNLFSWWAGRSWANVRDGKIRSQGPFSHSIIAGTIGAMMIPLFVGLWQYRKRDRVIAGLGVAAGLVMAGTSASSTPVLTIATVVLGFGLWAFRKNLRMIRWGLVGGNCRLALDNEGAGMDADCAHQRGAGRQRVSPGDAGG